MLEAFKKLDFKKRKTRRGLLIADDSRDEFYTPYCSVMEILQYYDLKGKKVYCPCDTEDSAFVRYMKHNNIEYKNTSDDYMKHDNLWQWADVIITNPPFSKPAQWLTRIIQMNKPTIFIHNMILKPLIKAREKYKKFKCTYERNIYKCPGGGLFYRPDGSVDRPPTALYEYTP